MKTIVDMREVGGTMKLENAFADSGSSPPEITPTSGNDFSRYTDSPGFHGNLAVSYTALPVDALHHLENMSEADRRAHADAMGLPELGEFIQPASQLNRRLIEAYRPYVQSWLDRTNHQGKPLLLTNGEGKEVTRDEYSKETWGVGVRRLNQIYNTAATPKPKSTVTGNKNETVSQFKPGSYGGFDIEQRAGCRYFILSLDESEDETAPVEPGQKKPITDSTHRDPQGVFWRPVSEFNISVRVYWDTRSRPDADETGALIKQLAERMAAKLKGLKLWNDAMKKDLADVVKEYLADLPKLKEAAKPGKKDATGSPESGDQPKVEAAVPPEIHSARNDTTTYCNKDVAGLVLENEKRGVEPTCKKCLKGVAREDSKNAAYWKAQDEKKAKREASIEVELTAAGLKHVKPYLTKVHIWPGMTLEKKTLLFDVSTADYKNTAKKFVRFLEKEAADRTAKSESLEPCNSAIAAWSEVMDANEAGDGKTYAGAAGRYKALAAKDKKDRAEANALRGGATALRNAINSIEVMTEIDEEMNAEREAAWKAKMDKEDADWRAKKPSLTDEEAEQDR